MANVSRSDSFLPSFPPFFTFFERSRKFMKNKNAKKKVSLAQRLDKKQDVLETSTRPCLEISKEIRRQSILKELVSGRVTHKDYVGKERKNSSYQGYKVTIYCLWYTQQYNIPTANLLSRRGELSFGRKRRLLRQSAFRIMRVSNVNPDLCCNSRFSSLDRNETYHHYKNCGSDI